MLRPHILSITMGLFIFGMLTISCAKAETTVAEIPAAELVPIIWDDDGSRDGVTALLYLLEHPSFEVKAATISAGIAHPEIFAPNLVRFFELIDRSGFPVAAGREQPLAGDNAFPDDWRVASDRFWSLELPAGGGMVDGRKAPQLIIDTVKGSEQPVMIFASGPLTNLAQALRLDPSIKEGIGTIEVMGGALEVDGNVWFPDSGVLPAEWNIYIDPLAAKEVFASGVEIRLTPLDATDQVAWREADAASWETSANPAGALAAQLLRQTLEDWAFASVLIWDLVAAVNVTDRGICTWEQVHIEVGLAEGPSEGQTFVVPDSPANVTVCLSGDSGNYKEAAQKVFAGSR